ESVSGTNIWGLPGGVASANFSTTKTGFVIGGGVETSIGALLGPLFGLANSNNWSMKLEYLYVDLGTVENTITTGLTPMSVIVSQSGPPAPCPVSSFCGVPGTATGTTIFHSSNHIYEHIIRVGINYRFSYAAVAPVVTKY